MFADLMNIENSLWDEFQRLRRDMDSLFSPGLGLSSIRAVARGSFPAVNVGTTADAVQVYLFAPGLDMSKLDVSIQNNLLTLAGERQIAEPQSAEQGGYHLRERFGGTFRRVISLSDDVNPDQVNAVYRNGVLTITIAKQEAAKPRQITVKSA